MNNPKRQEQKGINVTSETFITSENLTQRSTNDFPNLSKVKSDMNDAINNMDVLCAASQYTGGTTDADNDDSVYSTSVYSSIVKVHHISQNKDLNSMYNSPRDISEQTQMESENYCRNNCRAQELLSHKPICVPAVLPPAVLCMNPGCICSHAVAYSPPIATKAEGMGMHQDFRKYRNVKCSRKRKLSNLIQKLTHPSKNDGNELYKINIKQQNGNPKRFIFDRVSDDQKPLLQTIGTNTKIMQNRCACGYSKVQHNKSHVCQENFDNPNEILQNTRFEEPLNNNLYENSQSSQKDAARVDVYYFDHGNAAYYRTTDAAPTVLTEVLAEKAESIATKFWAELFGTVYIAFAFLTAFVLQFFRFTLLSIVRPLTIGLLQLISDYFLKPCLAVVFNAVIQPPLIFFYNIATSLRDLCDPIAEGFGYFIREVSVICKSIRLFEVNKNQRVSKCDSVEAKTLEDNDRCQTKSTKEKCEC